MAEEVMTVCTLASQICNQIAAVFSSSASSNALDAILTALADAAENHRRIFVHGVGREFLMLKSLCMRLVHLGLSAHVVGDVTTPPIRPHDLLIASAGPGSFSTVDAICAVARANSATVLLITAHPESPSCKKNLATHIAYLPARTMADDHTSSSSSSSGEDELSKKRKLLPMGSLYEGAMFVLFEVVVYKLGDILGEAPAAITLRHTNLE